MLQSVGLQRVRHDRATELTDSPGGHKEWDTTEQVSLSLFCFLQLARRRLLAGMDRKAEPSA